MNWLERRALEQRKVCAQISYTADDAVRVNRMETLVQQEPSGPVPRRFDCQPTKSGAGG